MFCEAAGCTTPKGVTCLEQHVNPVELPPPTGSQVPEHLLRVVSACRNTNPHDRPAAWELLKMFPEVTDPRGSQSESPSGLDDNMELMRPLDLARDDPCSNLAPKRIPLPLEEMWGDHVTCDSCGQRAYGKSFHCRICHGGNYELCPRCFSQGIHCPEPEHFLLERPTEAIARKLYSRPRIDGQRELVYL
jgi:hypothetical protein